MDEPRSKWSDPAVILSAVSVLVVVSGVVWSASQIASASAALSKNFDDFKNQVTVQISAVQAQIASLPTQGVRLDNLERAQREIRVDNAAQTVDINAVRQGLAVLASTVDGIRHDLQVVQDAANGKLGGRR